jgi:hypothetical protein
MNVFRQIRNLIRRTPKVLYALWITRNDIFYYMCIIGVNDKLEEKQYKKIFNKFKKEISKI